MRWWSELRHRLAALFRGRRLDRELDDELTFHLEMEAAERRRRGMPEAEARRTARADFGGLERTREECREARGTALLHDLGRDLAFGLRLARREAAATAVLVPPWRSASAPPPPSSASRGRCCSPPCPIPLPRT
jgi:hypothetical protein